MAVSAPFRKGAVIRNNVFDGSKLAAGHDIVFSGNEMNDTSASLIGRNMTIDGMVLNDATLRITNEVANGITVNGLTVNHRKGQVPGLVVEGEPSRFTNVTLNGQAGVSGISGNVKDGSLFDRLRIVGYGNGVTLPRGTYANCYLEAAVAGAPAPIVSKDGKVVLDGCTIKTMKSSALLVASAGADVTVKNSTLSVAGPLFGDMSVVQVGSAKSIALTGNTIRAADLTMTYLSIVKIKSALQAVVADNTISSNLRVGGINTISSPLTNPAYTIRNNKLYNTVLQLRPIDLASANQLLAGQAP